MKRAAALILVLFIGTAGFSGDNFDYAIYEQYRIAPLHYAYPKVRLDYNLKNSENNIKFWTADSGDLDLRNLQSDFRGNLAFTDYYESEGRIRNFSMQISPMNQISVSEQESNSSSHLKNNETILIYDFDYSDRFYLTQSKSWYWGLSTKVSGQIIKRKYISENNQNNNDYYHDERSNSNYQDHNLSFLAGKGRVRNVTSLHRAMLMLKRYGEKSGTTPNLEPQQIVHLAQTLESRKKFTRLYYRSAKEFWKTVAETFDTLGLSLDNLDLYSTLYLTESINLLHHPRYTGSRFEIKATLLYDKNYSDYSSYNQSDSLLSKNDDWDESLYLLINPNYTFHRPLSLRSSLNLSAQILAGPAISPQARYQQQYAFIFGTKHYYDITDRMMSTLGASYSYYRYNNNPSQTPYDAISQNLSLTSSLKIYFIDVAYLEIAYDYSHRSNQYVNRENSPDTINNRGTFKIALTYGPGSPSI